MENRRWSTTRPDPSVCIAAATRAGRTAEQDAAAGGPAKRRVVLSDGRTATASIQLALFPKSRRLYAYLTFKTSGRNVSVYVGNATAPTRKQALRAAWRKVAERGMLSRAADKAAQASTSK